MDHRGRPCQAPETLPPGSVHMGVGGGSRHPVLYYVPVGAVAGFVALVWLVVIDPALTPVLGFRTKAWGAGVAAGIAAIATDRLLARRIARSKWGALCRLALADWACPACGYALSGAPTEPDGCVVCPECGAAWRGSGLGEPAEPAPGPRP